MSPKLRKVLSAVVSVVAVLIILAILENGSGKSHSSPAQPAAAANPYGSAPPGNYCYGDDSYGTVVLQADASSESSCISWVQSMGLVAYSGTVPGGIQSQGVECIASDTSRDPAIVTVTIYGLDMCSQLAADGYGEIGLTPVADYIRVPGR